MRIDPNHDEVCLTREGHTLVVAPPGTGKTFLSVRLAAEIVPSLQSFERILLLTFSNQARSQLEKEAAKQLSSEMRKKIDITNYHGFFWREVMGHRRALGLPMDLRIGSFNHRREAFDAANSKIVRQLAKKTGLLESLAEHSFECFHDDRTPDAETLEILIAVIEQEQRAGRLVFDDLGALFWKLLEKYPVLDQAYKSRYPVVIADEHQDASELQDAVVRRLSTRLLVILADPMQLIYTFRGSRPERLQKHIEEATSQFELDTPHRWHGNELTGNWLLAVRRRLLGESVRAAAPGTLNLINFTYPGQMKARTREQVRLAFQEGMETIAVIGFTNSDVAGIRDYLSKQGMYPRQIGGKDFEDAQDDIEQLPLLNESQDIAFRAIDRLQKLVPTLRTNILQTVRNRLLANEINLSGRLGSDARKILQSLQPIYEHGSAHYFSCLADLLKICNQLGHHLPRIDAIRPIRETAAISVNDNIELNEVINRYSEFVATTSQIAPIRRKGLDVMTAHQAKGKEYDAVILVNTIERNLPDTDEGKRLFYVAITRASKRWTVISQEGNESALLRHL